MPEVSPRYGIPFSPDVSVDHPGPLLRLNSRAQAIITQGIGVYATPLLQPTKTTTRTAQGNPVYISHPTAIALLPVPRDTDIIFFTDASGTQQRMPRSVVLPCLSPGVRTAFMWSTTPGPPSSGRPPLRTAHPGGRRHCHTTPPTHQVLQHLGSGGRWGHHSPHKAPRGPTHPQDAGVRPHHRNRDCGWPSEA